MSTITDEKRLKEYDGTRKSDMSRGARFVYALRRDYQIWILLLPALAYFIVFHYLPLYGIQIAFKDYKAVLGILGSPWVGLKQFEYFFSSYYAGRMILNTLLLNVYQILWSFPMPIILAIMLNQVNQKNFRRFTQTIIYVPNFISTIVLVGILYLFLAPNNGFVNNLIRFFGGNEIFFMNDATWFRTVFIASGIWQSAGWSAIIYIAALTGIDMEIYEAATIDGASKRQKIIHIDIPHLVPIMTMILILNCGHLLGSNTDKVLVMQQAGNRSISDIIGVFVYTQGLERAQYSFTAAVGLMTNLVNFVLIISVNWISKKLNQTGLF